MAVEELLGEESVEGGEGADVQKNGIKSLESKVPCDRSVLLMIQPEKDSQNLYSEIFHQTQRVLVI